MITEKHFSKARINENIEKPMWVNLGEMITWLVKTYESRNKNSANYAMFVASIRCKNLVYRRFKFPEFGSG